MRGILLRELDLLPVWQPRKAVSGMGFDLRLSGSGLAPCIILTPSLDNERRSLMKAMMCAVGFEMDRDISLVEFDKVAGGNKKLVDVLQQSPQWLFLLTAGGLALPDEILAGLEHLPRLISYSPGYLIEHPEKKAKAWRDWLELKLVLAQKTTVS